jgi:hypothetical protein
LIGPTQLPPNSVKDLIVIGLNKETGPPNARGKIMFHRKKKKKFVCLSTFIPCQMALCLAPLFISDPTPQPRQAMESAKYGFKFDNLPASTPTYMYVEKYELWQESRRHLFQDLGNEHLFPNMDIIPLTCSPQRGALSGPTESSEIWMIRQTDWQ